MSSGQKNGRELFTEEGRGVWGTPCLLGSPLCKAGLLPPGLPLPKAETKVCGRRVHGLQGRGREGEREGERNRDQIPTDRDGNAIEGEGKGQRREEDTLSEMGTDGETDT